MKIRRCFVLFSTILLLSLLNTTCKPIPETKSGRLIELVDNYGRYRNFSGALLVAEKGQVIFKKAYGYSNFELETENTLNTKFRIASITKEITAILVMQELENGNLALNGLISDYLSDFPEEIGNQVTVHHLLSHSSGILDFPDIPNFDIFERMPHSFNDLVAHFEDKPLLFEPGSQFRYSNLNYVILANILEKVSGQTYNELMQKRIFDPAGMHNSGIDDNLTVVKNRAYGCYHLFLKDGNSNATHLDMSVVRGAGDVYSTVEDMFKFDQALTNNLFISAESLSKILSPNIYPNMQYCGYGWDIRPENWGKDGEQIIVSGGAGSINGFKSNYRRFDNGNCIIVFQNYRGKSGNTLEVASTQEIVSDISAILYEREYSQPLKSGAAILGRTLTKGQVDSLSVVFDSIIEDGSRSTILNGQEILDLCYYFLNNDGISYIHELLKLDILHLFAESVELSQLAAFYNLCGEMQKATETITLVMQNNEYGENLLNSIGYHFLNIGQHAAALYLFKVNTQLYSESSNVYDSYAEALLKNNEIELAIENLEKSLAINPNNANAWDLLNGLK